MIASRFNTYWRGGRRGELPAGRDDGHDQSVKAMKDAEIEAEIEDFLEGFNQPTYRGMRVGGVRMPVWSSQHGWSGL